MHYRRWLRHGDPLVAQRMQPRDSTVAQRLEALSDRSGGPDACWPWTGTTYKHSGYGTMKVRGVEHAAHIWSFMESGGVTTDEKPFVLHSCDNPPCINPRHLRAGSNQDNMDDKVERGRQAWGPDFQLRRTTKLNVTAVREIRAARADGESTAVIAERFGVSCGTVKAVVARTRWAWVEDGEPV